MNPINRFLYWNMGYHVEHHMFPLVPYHALPKLHAIVKDDMPPPYPSIISAYREIIPAVCASPKIRNIMSSARCPSLPLSRLKRTTRTTFRAPVAWSMAGWKCATVHCIGQ
jgi:fatty acid desaturase